MSKQAEVARVATAFDLEEAMRQAQRYLGSQNPNPRLVQQKADKVAMLENELKKVHLSYCEKSNIDIDDEDAKKYIRQKCDAAIDVIDECMLFIEEEETKRELSFQSGKKTKK